MPHTPFDAQVVPRKTHAGAQALLVRDASLTPSLRRLLLLTDGTRTVFTLSQLLPDLDVAAAMARLADLGMVDNSQTARPNKAVMIDELPEGWETASEFMMSRARESLGVAAADVIDRIEQADNPEAAREAMSQWYRAMRGSRNGRGHADEDRVKVVAMLGRV